MAAAAETVSDMPAETDWSYAALKAAMDNDLLRGSGGALQPEALLTRSQLAAVVVRAFGARTASDLTTYADVAASAWYHDDMARAVAMGVLNGSDGYLRPEDSITRQEAFTILARAMKLSGGPVSALDSYSDRGNVASWAEDAMAALISGGYIQGNGANLNPAAAITRAEFAQVMYKLISSYIDKPGAYDKVAEGTVMVRAGGVKLKGVSLTRDLILGDGIDAGDATLDSITVAERTVIRGGGSVLVQGGASLGAVVIDRPTGGVALKLQDKAAVGSITICSDGVALSGIPKGTSVTVNKGVTGATLEGTALPEGTTSAPGAAVASGGGGGNPPATTVATTAMAVSPAAQTMAAGVYEGLTVTRNTGANDALTWSSSDETVAVVDAAGKVGARKSGEAVIAVQSASGVVASATVYVQEPTGGVITISVPGTVLTGGSYTKIIVAASVGTGDYTLNGVTVGTLETRGGGIHSGHIAGGSVGIIDIQGTPEEGSRVLLSGGAVVGEVNVGGAAGGAALEVAPGSGASVGSVTSNASLTVTNTVVTNIITAGSSSGVILVNSSTPELATFGSTPAPVPVTLNGSSVGTLNAGAVGGTTVSGGAILPMVIASGSVTTGTGVGVGTITASGSSSITTNGPVGSITGTAGPVSLNNSGGTRIDAGAGSLSVSGASAPVVSGTVTSGIIVNANPEGSSGVTVLAGSPPIATAGSGSVGQISVGGDAAPTITANAPIGAISVTDAAAPTVGGSAQVSAVVSSSSGTTTVSNTNTAAILATDTEKVSGAGAENKTQAAVVTLQSIAVTTYPTKLNYAVGSPALNTAGMVVTGYYTVTGFDGTVSRVLTAGTDYTVGTVDMSGPGTKTVTVTASGKTASFPVNVVEETVGLVSVTKLPAKLAYEKGESLNLTGGELTVVYTDSTLYPNVKVSLTDEMVSGYSANTPGVQTLTVTHVGKTAVFTVTVKDSLGEAKAAAKNELNAHAAMTLASAPYSAAGRAAIETARKSGETAIGVAPNATEVSTALATTKATISNVLNQAGEWESAARAYRETQSAILVKTPETVAITDKAAVNKALVAHAALEAGVQARLTAEKARLDTLLAKIAALEAAQTLEGAKAMAAATLNAAYANYSNGYTTNHAAIEAAKTAGLASIGAAASVAAVTAALDKALADMAAVKSDAILLVEAKTAAIAELNTYAANKSKGDYDAAGKAAIEAARRTGETAITAATDTEAVPSALNAAKTDINAVKTTAQVAAEKLAAAKVAAKAELTAYGNSGLYSGPQKTAFDNAKAQGVANIDAAASVAAVTAALNAAKVAVTAVKTDAQVTAEELSAAKTAAKAAIAGHKKQDSYSPAGWALVTNIVGKWQAAVDACTLTPQVAADVDEAKTELNTVTTAVQEKTANQSLVNSVKTAVEGAGYTVAQAQISTEAQALTAIKAIVDGKHNAAVTAVITKVSYTAAVAGSVDAPDGTDGRYIFTVSLTAGKAAQAGYGDTSASAATGQLTLTITATAYTGESNVAAVARAKGLIIDGTVSVAFGADQAAKTAAVQAYVNSLLSDTGVSAVVALKAGTIYTVTLSKGTAHDSKDIDMTITEAADPDAAIADAALTAVNGAVYGPVAQGNINSEDAAMNYVKGIAVTAVGNLAVTVDVNGTYTPAVAGGKDNAAGTNGSYVFTVMVSKGAQSRTSGSKTLVITATKVLSRADLTVALYTALKEGYGLDDDTGVTHSFTDVDGLPDGVQHAISFCYNNGLAVGISNTAFVPAAAVTRAEAAAVLSRIVPAVTGFELEHTVDLTGKYTDVAADKWYYDSVMAMGGAGVFPADKEFRPEAFITPGELSTAVNNFKGKLDALYTTSVRVADGDGLASALGNSAVQRITLGGKVVLGVNAVLRAGKTLYVGANTALIIGEGVTLGTEAGSTIYNNSLILVGAGGVLNNSGTVEGRWIDGPNSDNPNDGWYESCVVTDLVIGSNIAGTVNNTGTIRDMLQINDYLADTSDGDVLGGYTNAGTVDHLRPVATIETTAALERALENAEPKYAEIDGLGAFALTGSVTVPESVQLVFPKAWEEDGVRIDTFLTIASGVTLTIAGGGELRVNCNASNAGTIVNRGYMEVSGGMLTITGAVDNHGYFGIHDGGKVVGGVHIDNSGTIEAMSVYAQGENMLVALDGCSGGGELRHTAYVYDGGLLGAAADNTSVSAIMIAAEGEARTVTMSGDVTTRPGVNLYVPVFVDDNNPEAIRQSVTLVIPSGASLTVDGFLNVAGVVEVQTGGTLTLNGEASLREKIDESIVDFGTLKNAGSVTLGANAVLDCGGDIITTGTFTNNGEIRIHPNSGTGHPQYGTVTGTIMGNPPVCIAIVNSEEELRAALDDAEITAIRTVGDMKLAGDVTFTKLTIITQGRVTAANHNLTVTDGITVIVTQDGTLNFHSETSGSILTVGTGATLRALDGGRLIIGMEEETGHASSAAGSVVNNGRIESRHAEIRFVDAEEWQVLTGNPVIYQANRADLVRMLGRQLRDYLEHPTDDEIAEYAQRYSDWRDMGEDEDAWRGFGLLVKNDIIHGTGDGQLSPYGDLNYFEMKELFSRIADELLGTDYDNPAMTAFLSRIEGTGAVTYSHRQYGAGDYAHWDNSLNELTREFVEALGLYRAEVGSLGELETALGKPYVTEISIVSSFELPAGSGGEPLEAKLTGIWSGERIVTVEEEVTLTIPQNARLTIEQGVTLVLNGKLVNNGGMDVFGGLQPDDWWDENSGHYEQVEGAYINFYPDFLDLANRLHERVSDQGLAEVSPEDVPGWDGEGWPHGDDREGEFAFLVTYGKVQRKSEDEHAWWPAYDKVTYEELKGILTQMRQAIWNNSEPLPGSVKLDYEKDDEHFVNDGELEILLERFARTLPRAVDNETIDVIGRVIEGEGPIHYDSKKFTQKITVSCEGSTNEDGWGGEVIFDNCEFAGGLEIKLGGVSYGVSLKGCDAVTEGRGLVVSPADGETVDLFDYVARLDLRDVPDGQTVIASVPVSVASRVAGGSFTLNGVTVAGVEELGGDMAYGAALRLESYGEDSNPFQCAALDLFGEVSDINAVNAADFAGRGICTYELFERGEGVVTLDVGTVNMSGTENPLRIRNSAEGSRLVVTGSVIGSVELSRGEIDVSTLMLVDGRVYVGTWDDRGVTAIVGDHETELVGGGEYPAVIRAGEGAVIHMEGLTTEYVNQLTVNPGDGSEEGIFRVGVPHIFGEAGSYQVYVGTTDPGMSFKVSQGETELDTTAAYVNEEGQSGEEITPVKVHLSFAEQPQDFENMTLHLIKGNITLIVRLELKGEPQPEG
ncbi:MAG TPA: S-layer homology domain-containing protein [Pseudoflavonifractor sp.]|nr:S-layer homology domain-containing protein [Pseudoflavonifractor sp.]